MKKTRTIQILGRRWFQRGPGNTYHTVSISVNGDRLHKTEPQYGYGSQYNDTAKQWLFDNGYLPGIEMWDRKPEIPNPGISETLWRYCERKNIKLVDDVVDVTRERDL